MSRSVAFLFAPRVLAVVVGGGGGSAARRQILNRDRREIEKLLPS